MTERIRRCRHARHPKPMVDSCALGVDVEALVGKFGTLGRWYRLPCHDQTSPDIAKCACDKRDFFTDAEVVQQDIEDQAVVNEFVRRHNAVVPLLDRIRSGSQTSGEDPCPACKVGMLSWGMSPSNNHIHARCSSEDCLAFME